MLGTILLLLQGIHLKLNIHLITRIKLRKEKTMNHSTKVHMCLMFGVALMAVLNSAPLMVQAAPPPPVIQAIVPETTTSAGYGQMITIQGFNLIQDYISDNTTVTFTKKPMKKGCNDVFLFQPPSTANELYVRIFNPGGLCDIGNGKYKVTVTTPAGTSNPWEFQVKTKPEAPIPRKVSFAGDPNCPLSTDYDICVQAYGTDTASITAVFSQNGKVVSAPLIITFSSHPLGLTHGFKLPALTSGETALVQLRTTVDGIDSDLSFALLFTSP
jgi:hypothetical protein